MPRITQNAVLDADGSITKISTVDSILSFLKRFNALTVKGRSGYDKYVNNNGYTNPETAKCLNNQGLGKLIATSLEQLHTRIAQGDADAKAILDGIRGYDAIAAAEATKRVEDALAAAKLAEFTDKNKLEAAVAPVEAVAPIVAEVPVVQEVVVAAPVAEVAAA